MVVRESKKTVAIVHDALIEWGGAEKVLDEILSIFPKASVYTSVCLPRVQEKLINLNNRSIQVSWLQPFWSTYLPRRIIQLFSPFIWRFSDIKGYDVIIIHSGFYLSKLIALSRPKQQNICYLITPPKNVHSRKLSLELILFYTYYVLLRFLDKKSNGNISHLLTVSKAVNQRVENIYQKEGLVIYPPCFVEPAKLKLKKRLSQNTFGYFGRLSSEKNLELLIKTFRDLPEFNLEIIGEGDMRNILEKNSSKNISFLGYMEGKKLYNKVSQWQACIHPAIEDDFPLAVVESLSLGTPVICHQSGGVTDYIQENSNGFFFQENTVRSLTRAILKSQTTSLSSAKVSNSVKKYSKKRFRSQLTKIVYEKN